MKYLWLDTEGTGFFDFNLPAHALSQPRVCAIGGLLIDHGFRIEEEFEFLIKPDGWFLDPNSEAAKVNGLTMEELERDGIPIIRPLRIYAQALDEGRVIGGHNVTHDLKMMRGELRRAEQDDRFMRTRSICTMRMAPRDLIGAVDKNGKLKAPRLEELCNHFGITVPRHRALDDARASFLAFRKLCEIGIMPKITNPYDKPTKGAKRGKKKTSDDGGAETAQKAEGYGGEGREDHDPSGDGGEHDGGTLFDRG